MKVGKGLVDEEEGWYLSGENREDAGDQSASALLSEERGSPRRRFWL